MNAFQFYKAYTKANYNNSLVDKANYNDSKKTYVTNTKDFFSLKKLVFLDSLLCYRCPRIQCYPAEALHSTVAWNAERACPRTSRSTLCVYKMATSMHALLQVLFVGQQKRARICSKWTWTFTPLELQNNDHDVDQNFSK